MGYGHAMPDAGRHNLFAFPSRLLNFGGIQFAVSRHQRSELTNRVQTRRGAQIADKQPGRKERTDVLRPASPEALGE